MSTRENTCSASPDVTRREFLGSATLTAAGVATGLSFYLLKPKCEDLSKYSKPENQVRLGYIGVGNRGLALMRSSLQVPGNVPVAVCDSRRSQREAAIKDIQEAKLQEHPDYADPEKRKGIKPYKVDEYDDYRRILDRKDIEAVFIATPHFLHGPMAIDAIQAGKHVYCEKAMAYTIGENQDIYRLVKASSRQVFQVGHQRHYSPLYQKVIQLIRDDTIGNVAAIRAQWNKNDVIRRTCPDPEMDRLINWRLYSEYSGGLTTEFASHQIDVANWVFNTHPDSVCGYGGVDWFADGRDTTDNIHLIYNYKVPVLARDKYGRVVDADGKPVKDSKKPAAWEKGPDGKVKRRDVRFSYMSIMQNSHLGPSELIMGEYGTLEVSLLGGESFTEDKQRPDPEKKETAKPAVKAAASKVQLTEGGLPRRYGKVITMEQDPTNWVHFTKEIAGAYDREETLLAVHGFLECVRKSRDPSKSFAEDVKANVEWGLWGAVPALMANEAMRENRTVYWSEYFPEDVT